MKIRNKKEIKVSDEERLLCAFAEKNKGKYGSDEDMFASLKQEYEREREGGRAVEKAKPVRAKRRLTIAFASAAAVLAASLAVMLPLLLRDKGAAGTPDTPPVHEIVDGLTVIPVTETQLIDGLGFTPAIPRPVGYNLDIVKIFKNGEDEIKAYYLKYSNIIDSDTKNIEIYCVLNNDFIFSLEKQVDDNGIIQFIPPDFVMVFMDSKNVSLSRIVKGDKYIISLNEHNSVLLSGLIQELKK